MAAGEQPVSYSESKGRGELTINNAHSENGRRKAVYLLSHRRHQRRRHMKKGRSACLRSTFSKFQKMKQTSAPICSAQQCRVSPSFPPMTHRFDTRPHPFYDTIVVDSNRHDSLVGLLSRKQMNPLLNHCIQLETGK